MSYILIGGAISTLHDAEVDFFHIFDFSNDVVEEESIQIADSPNDLAQADTIPTVDPVSNIETNPIRIVDPSNDTVEIDPIKTEDLLNDRPQADPIPTVDPVSNVETNPIQIVDPSNDAVETDPIQTADLLNDVAQDSMQTADPMQTVDPFDDVVEADLIQTSDPVNDIVEIDSFEISDFSDEINVSPWSIELEMGYAAGQFIGFDENYAEFGAFFRPEFSSKVQPVVDVRGYRLENGFYAASAGIGMRWWNGELTRVQGANLFYDYQNASLGNDQRIGIGLESLGEYLDYRLNIYIPMNGETQYSSLHIYEYSGGFIATCREKKFSFKGLDSELGLHIWRSSNFSLYGAAGPYYYYHKQVKGVLGGQVFLELKWMSYLTLEVCVSYDQVYNMHTQGKIMFNVPLTDLFYGRQDDPARELINQKIRRNNLSFTETCCDWTWNW